MHKDAIALLTACLLNAAAVAQEANGAVRGTIKDATHARVAGAEIVLEREGTLQRRLTLSNARGEFDIEGLMPGSWHVSVSRPGFAPAASEVVVAVSSASDLSVDMQPARVLQQTAVAAHTSSIATQTLDYESSVLQSVVTAKDLAEIPLAERSFANIAYLAPGTEPVEPSDPTKARITAISTGGSSGLNNELSVDGADNSDDYIGGFLQNYSADALEEFAVRTGQEEADTGGTTAGSIVLTTKSGTNAVHGSAAIYERAAALNARYPIENPQPDPKQPFSRQNYVGTLGGPLHRDRLWFFTAVEGVHEDASIAYSAASEVEFQALAALANSGVIPGVSAIDASGHTVPIPFRDVFGLVRCDWGQTEHSQWFLRASTDTYTTHNNLVQQGALPSTGLLTHNNYFSLVIGNEYVLSPEWLGRLVLNASGLHLTETRNSHLGFALAFPFSSTALTVSGFETFGDNQFATPITYFPSERDQQKYQFRYDVNHTRGRHAIKFGTSVVHEPVLSGAFPSNAETLYQLAENPTYYVSYPGQFAADLAAGASTSSLGGGFAQNVQRLALYAQDAWQVKTGLVLNYGVRYSTTYGLLEGSGRAQTENPGYLTLTALDIPLVRGAPHDDRRQIAPRVGFAYAMGERRTTLVRGGFGLYFNDLAQSGWAAAMQAVGEGQGACVDPVQNPSGVENAGCVRGSANRGVANLIDPGYRTPYAIHISAGLQHAFSTKWSASADLIHEQGNHAYRAYSYQGGTDLFTSILSTENPAQAVYVPDVNVFHSDNRSSYSGLLAHLQGGSGRRAELVANYTYSKAQTWGCVLGELFDYVNGVCNALDAFGAGDYGPSGEDVRHRIVLAGTWLVPGGLMVSGLSQAESARPFTITTADNKKRIEVNGAATGLDAFRGRPYVQTDLRVSRTFKLGDRWTAAPFAECFNLFNRSNAGANFVTNVASLAVPAGQAQAGDVKDVCTDMNCSKVQPVTRLQQLAVPAGALGDFFGAGTTVGIPFAAQVGARFSF